MRIQARGNFSLNATGLVLLLLIVAVMSLGLAGFLAWKGYWPILLIAIAQLAIVAWVLVHVWKNAWALEEICIDGNQIRIHQQRYQRQSLRCLESAWATIRLEKPDVPWHATKLVLRSHSEEVELGAFLTDDEKLNLAQHLSIGLSERTAWGKP